ncbi:MAG: hypothetical protein HOB98_06065 [Gammaproteobacteria bacterium]|mgnify:FL=1|nr:hypothetical protein [Gammaproteobacteria bacterium]MBT3867997.1 hypothetical protein [Gammaproteobacteria bacterium]MBT4379589.1 hypothetical protein [Gammaproteobacteria bacterium]MBT4615999.1 hypothetical protein [Gammaproteobacteria bacterium]MBT5200197.1 hypothetical protein [Gammaproteobacteria bacterium]
MSKTIDQPAGKSDRAIVPMKQSNNPSKDAAETGEGRALTKRNVGDDARAQTQSWNSTMSRLARVRKAAIKDSELSFNALMHHLTPEQLRASFYELNRQAARGVDGVSWNDYQLNLEPRIQDLYTRIQSGQYRPLPARRIFIPKEDGDLRRRMHHPVVTTLKWLQKVVRGHLNYYGVPGNGRQLSRFLYEIVGRWFKVLRRRSQRYSITWSTFGPWVWRVLPSVRIVHPYPEERFHAKYSR